MRYAIYTLLSTIALPLMIVSCNQCEKTYEQKMFIETEQTVVHNSIYHWRTTFALDSAERAFIEHHNINRIYLRMFDVALEQNYETTLPEIVPIATTRFVDTIPANCEVVPVAYITIDALRAMQGEEAQYAHLIVERMKAMCSYNNCGTIKELQLDCDWTQTTRESYATLCRAAKDSLHKEDIALSITVRLHQLQEDPPPANRAVLMLYNTGALKEFDTHNSILDIKDVKPYIKPMKYPIPLSYAYPFFGWGVKFKDEEFVAIVSAQDSTETDNEHIRLERATYNEIAAVKELIESNLGKPQGGNILYHLDNTQLHNYTNNEIDQILTF